MKKLFCLCFLLIFNFCQAHRYELSICTIFKNEAPYLKEWIEYHRLVGVQHFYLFNDNSVDDYYHVLKPYIKAGIVELENAHTQADFNGTQVDCYNRALIKSRGKSFWVAFIDTDEFILPSSDVNLSRLLSHYKQFAGVAINWRCFGTSNIQKLNPDEPMISQLLLCSTPDYLANVHIRSIVQPKLVAQFYNPHNPAYVPGYFAVDVEMIHQEGAINQPPKFDPIRINHYWTRDQYYFDHFKKPRRMAWGDTEENLDGSIVPLNTEFDDTICRYVPRLKKALKKERI